MVSRYEDDMRNVMKSIDITLKEISTTLGLMCLKQKDETEMKTKMNGGIENVKA